jgi:hypothetical protein
VGGRKGDGSGSQGVEDGILQCVKGKTGVRGGVLDWDAPVSLGEDGGRGGLLGGPWL